MRMGARSSAREHTRGFGHHAEHDHASLLLDPVILAGFMSGPNFVQPFLAGYLDYVRTPAP
jgi:hypothetical protein